MTHKFQAEPTSHISPPPAKPVAWGAKPKGDHIKEFIKWKDTVGKKKKLGTTPDNLFCEIKFGLPIIVKSMSFFRAREALERRIGISRDFIDVVRYGE